MDEVSIEKAMGNAEEKPSDIPTPKDADLRNIVIIVSVVVAILVLSLSGYTLVHKAAGAQGMTNEQKVDQLHEQNKAGKLSEREGYIYNGYSFVRWEGLWWTQFNHQGRTLKIPLHFGPREVSNINIVGNLSEEFNANPDLYIAIDPNIANKYYTLALSELNFNLAKGINRRPVGACTEPNEICENRTITGCNNTQGLPVLELQLQEKSGIELSGTCIKVTGQEYDLVQAVDRLLYKWYGVMK